MTQRAIVAAVVADWMQVVYNGGPPCFHLEGNRFCLRAKRWEGHGESDHTFVSLADLLVAVSSQPKGKPRKGKKGKR